MKRFLLPLLGAAISLSALARDFTYSYEGNTLTYTVLDEDAKTCQTKAGTSEASGNTATGELIIPATAKDDNVDYTVVAIGEYGFQKQADLTKVVLPETVTSIERYAFFRCEILKNVNIPEAVRYVDAYAFKYCAGLTSVTIPNGRVNGGAFEDCTALTSVVLGSGVTSVTRFSFYGCYAIESVTVEATTPPTAFDTTFALGIYSRATLYVPKTSEEAYRQAEGWSDFTNIATFGIPAKLAIALPNGKIYINDASTNPIPLTIKADEGWKISTATLGDTDITADIADDGTYTVEPLVDDETLNVVFVQKVVTSVHDVRGDAATPKVYASNGRVRVEGTEPGAEVKVYDINGRCLLRTTDHDFDAPASGLMLLTVGGNTYKFAL